MDDNVTLVCADGSVAISKIQRLAEYSSGFTIENTALQNTALVLPLSTFIVDEVFNLSAGSQHADYIYIYM